MRLKMQEFEAHKAEVEAFKQSNRVRPLMALVQRTAGVAADF
jgi:hypothetical protein